MVKKNDENLTDGDQLKYIIVTLNYDTKLILPIAEGMEFIRIWATGLQLKESYKKPPKISPVNQDFTLKFLTDKDLKIMQVSQILDPEEGEENV